MTKAITLTFDFPLKEVLSSNRLEPHYSTKAKKVLELRRVAIAKGLEHHLAEDLEAVKLRIDALQRRQDAQTKKSRASKLLKKSNLSKEEIDEKLEAEFGTTTSYAEADAIEVPFLFQKVRIRVLVGNTVNRDFDPPNFWPTIKAITDGLTDCAWWEDDNFNFVTEVAFGYGERSDKKGHYRFTLIFEPVE